MIEIINDKGLVLELSDNFTFTIECANPLFQTEDEFFQDITYPGKAPLTDNNKIFIGSGHLIEISVYSYELPVRVLIDETTFFSGNMAYDIKENEISFVLKFGYAAVADLCENTMLYEVDYGANLSVVYANKNSSVINPDQWPFAYFPTYHNTEVAEEYDRIGEAETYYSNPYDYQNQKKYEFISPYPKPWRDIAHFKLNYILDKVIRFIGFQPAGTFFSSEITESLYIYNLQYAKELFTTNQTTNAAWAVPHISITDFFKALKERFRVNIVFDHIRKIATISEPNSLLKSTDYVDISQYVSAVGSVNTPVRWTYIIKAKKQDNEYNPPNFIQVKDKVTDKKLPEKPVEIPISTLPIVEDELGTFLYPLTQMPFLTGRAIGGTPEPPPRERRWQPPYDASRHSNLLLMKYTGLKLVYGSMYFPSAETVGFTQEDGDWFAYINDSKVIKIKASIPTHILSQIDTNKKIGFISEQNFFLVGIIEKVEYTLQNDTRDLIETTIEVRALLEKISDVEILDNILIDDQKPPLKPNIHFGPRPYNPY